MPHRDRLDFLAGNWHHVRPELDIRPWQVWGRTTRLHELFLAAISVPLARHGLNFKEFQTLGALVLGGPPYEANPSEIVKLNLLTSGGMANLIGRMEREGLVSRHPDTADKRGVRIRLTRKGLRAFETAVVDENRVEHLMLAALSDDERVELARLLRKLLLALDPVPVPTAE